MPILHNAYNHYPVTAEQARWWIRPISGFWGAKLPKMCDSLPWTPMNRRAKYDAASFILGEKKSITVQTHTHTKLQKNIQTNSKRYITIILFCFIWTSSLK